MELLIPFFVGIVSAYFLGQITARIRYRARVKKVMARVMTITARDYPEAVLLRTSPKDVGFFRLIGLDFTETNFQYFLQKLSEEFDKI